MRPSASRGAGPAGLARDRSGATAVVIGVTMTALLGFAGLAVDAGVWYADRRHAQAASDSAAYSAAIDIAAGDTVAGARTAAKAITAQYGLTDGAGGVTVTLNSPPATGPNTATTGAVEVIVRKTESLYFSQFFVSSQQVSARAVALAGSTGGKYCVLALDPASGVTVSASNGITVNLTACGLQVDGTGSGALTVVGGAVVSATTVSVVGNIVTNNGGSVSVSGVRTTGAPSLPDPYAGLAIPSPGTCSNTTFPSYGAFTIPPGTYCHGLSIANGESVTFNAGTYIIMGGVFSQQGGTTINATAGTTIVLTGNSSYSYATANIANGATLNLTAPATGPTAGMAIMQNRAAPASAGGVNCTSNCNYIAGGAALNVIGSMYFPHQSVQWSNGTSNTSKCTQLIAYDIQFTGGTKFSNTCGGTGVVGIGSAATTLAE